MDIIFRDNEWKRCHQLSILVATNPEEPVEVKADEFESWISAQQPKLRVLPHFRRGSPPFSGPQRWRLMHWTPFLRWKWCTQFIRLLETSSAKLQVPGLNMICAM